MKTLKVFLVTIITAAFTLSNAMAASKTAPDSCLQNHGNGFFYEAYLSPEGGWVKCTYILESPYYIYGKFRPVSKNWFREGDFLVCSDHRADVCTFERI